MSNIKKYLPIILALVGLVTLYLNWDQWRMMKAKDCNCGEGDSASLGAID